MKKYLLIALSFLLLSTTNAFAVPFPTLVQIDPTGSASYSITGVSEFDWSSIGNLVIEDALVGAASSGQTSLDAWLTAGVVNSTATFRIHGHTQLQNFAFVPGGGNASGLNLFNNANPGGNYEITATLDAVETATMTLNTDGNLELEFTSISGTFAYYLDSSPDSNPFTGSGFNSGDPGANPFLWGTLDDVSGDFELVAPGVPGGGSSDIVSTILGYNPNFINTDPASPGVFLVGSEFETSVEYRGAFSPDPDVIGDDPYNVKPEDLVLIADANSTFTAIPEPGTSLLIGIGLLGIAAVSRRKIS